MFDESDFPTFNLTPTGDSSITNEPAPLEVGDVTVKPDSAAYSYAVKVVETKAEIAAIEASIADKRTEVDAITLQVATIRAEMEAKINELTKARAEIEESMWDERKRIRTLTQELLKLERQMRLALDAEMAEKRFLEMSDVFDERIQGVKWREFALDHQISGAKYLANSGRCILADRMGLGKTLTSLAALDMLQAKRVLIIVPADVLSNFNGEIAYWAPHRSLMPMGKSTKAHREMAIRILKQLDSFIVTINYEAWRRDNNLLKDLIELQFDTVILDEAHTIKNTGTSAYKGVVKLVMAENSCPKCGGSLTENKQLIDNEGWSYHATACDVCDWDNKKNDVENRVFGDMRSVKNVFPMTGTPILNRPQDLFPMLHLVDPVNFSAEKDFLYTYCVQDYDGKWRFSSGGMERVVKRLSGKYIGRTRKDAGVILPEQKIQVHEIEITPEDYPDQYRVIEQLTKHAQIMLESGESIKILAQIALITRRRQANVWPAGIKLKNEAGEVVFEVSELVRESIKLDRLCRYENREWVGLIPEFTENGNFDLGERVVVFSQFKEPLRELETRLTKAGIPVARFDGDTPESKRVIIKEDFDRKFCDVEGYQKKFMVVLCNYKTGGVGLNFTGASQVVVLDEEWNPGKNEQAWGRVDRIGQVQENTVHILRMPRTVDTWMAKLIEDKKDMIDGFDQEINLQQRMLDAIKNGEMI